MSLVYKCSVGIFFACVGTASIAAESPGFLEGHLKIISVEEADRADQTPSKAGAENYADYPLIILNSDGKKEITRIAADANGNYHVMLQPGAYILDAEDHAHGHGLVRVKPQRFTIVSNQMVRVDMEIDTGIR